LIHEQKISTIIRHFPKGSTYGDPYDYTWNVIYHNITTVEIIGIHVAPTLSMTRELIEYFRSNGIKEIISNRKGRIISHYLDKQ